MMDLLWKIEEQIPEEIALPDGNLFLSDAVSLCHTRQSDVRYFLNILAKAPAKTENSLHRMGILRDFRVHPLLLDRLFICLRTLDHMPDDIRRERSLTHTRASFGSRARYQTALKQVVFASASVLGVFSRLKELLEILEKDELTASAFLELEKRLHAIFDNPAYTELCAVLEDLVRIPENFQAQMHFSLSALGRLCGYDAEEIGPEPYRPLPPRGIRRLFPSAHRRYLAEMKEYQTPPGVPVEGDPETLRNQALGGLYEKTADTLYLMLENIFGEFCGMSVQLDFYRTALSLIEFYEKHGTAYCFPDFSADGTTRITELKDFVLLTGNRADRDVIPNDVYFSNSTPGILIRGENSSGKTVYLRSIATALLFAQNGLPLPAKEAVITPCRKIRTLFASAEKATTVGTGAGRFEEEVAALSALVDELGSGDVLFLNEIFQTTAYAEGACGLKTILSYLGERGVRWVCVTHLTDLFTLFGKENAVLLETTSPTSETPYKLHSAK